MRVVHIRAHSRSSEKIGSQCEAAPDGERKPHSEHKQQFELLFFNRLRFKSSGCMDIKFPNYKYTQHDLCPKKTTPIVAHLYTILYSVWKIQMSQLQWWHFGKWRDNRWWRHTVGTIFNSPDWCQTIKNEWIVVADSIGISKSSQIPSNRGGHRKHANTAVILTSYGIKIQENYFFSDKIRIGRSAVGEISPKPDESNEGIQFTASYIRGLRSICRSNNRIYHCTSAHSLWYEIGLLRVALDAVSLAFKEIAIRVWKRTFGLYAEAEAVRANVASQMEPLYSLSDTICLLMTIATRVGLQRLTSIWARSATILRAITIAHSPVYFSPFAQEHGRGAAPRGLVLQATRFIWLASYCQRGIKSVKYTERKWKAIPTMNSWLITSFELSHGVIQMHHIASFQNIHCKA